MSDPDPSLNVVLSICGPAHPGSHEVPFHNTSAQYIGLESRHLTDKMSFTSIPILDMSLANDPKTKPAFLADLRDALMDVGFLYLKNVGIPDELFAEVIQQGRAFFGVPLEEKYRLKPSLSSLLVAWVVQHSPDSQCV